jgi:hypothetical protein
MVPIIHSSPPRVCKIRNRAETQRAQLIKEMFHRSISDCRLAPMPTSNRQHSAIDGFAGLMLIDGVEVRTSP